MELRLAGPQDSRLVWELRNDPEVRRQSFDTDPIPWDRHETWFANAIADDSRRIFIGEVDGKPIGVVRFDITDGVAEVSVMVAERGHGYGTKLLLLACEQIRGVRFVAAMRPDNLASQRVFEKAGFRATRMERPPIS